MSNTEYQYPEDAEYGLIVTGQKAQELLENETFQATVKELTEQITTAILGSNFPEMQKRHDLYTMYKALMSIVAVLEASAALKPIIQEGINAADENSELPDINED